MYRKCLAAVAAASLLLLAACSQFVIERRVGAAR